MKKRFGAARMSWDDFKRRFPAQAARVEEEDALKKGGATSLLPSTGKAHYNAKPTQAEWVNGHLLTFPSKTEARVADRLVREVRTLWAQEQAIAPARKRLTRIYRQVRVPLLSIDSDDRGIPYTLCVDFMIVYADGRRRYIDAKTKRKNREWARGRAAAQAELGITIEETDQ